MNKNIWHLNAPFARLIVATAVSLSLLTACQKPADDTSSTDATATDDIKVTKITPPSDTASPNMTKEVVATSDNSVPETQNEVKATESADSDDTNTANTVSSDNMVATETTESSENFSQESQITDVDYRSQSGDKLKVTFQTSAINELQANVQLPSGKRVLLTAPPAQGNNPTYRSKDGNIELVSHGGGGSVDLVQNGKITNFDATSAEAEVVVKE